MATNSKIKWTNHTFNPWRGCTMISAGCANCYADELSKRNPGVLGVWGKDGTRVVASDKAWAEPVKWNNWAQLGVCLSCKGRGFVTDQTKQKTPCADCNGIGRIAPYRARVFCASLADVFEDKDTMPAASLEEISEARQRLWKLIETTPFLDWQLLTKRSQNIAKLTPDRWWEQGFPANVWIGVTVENQKAADERIPDLFDIPARVRFLSCEPLLGEVNLAPFLWRPLSIEEQNACYDATAGHFDSYPAACERAARINKLHWAIVGGESGPNARPFHIEQARSIRGQCSLAGVEFFMKQLGERTVFEGETPMHFNHSQIGDMSWFPADLQVQNFPEVIR